MIYIFDLDGTLADCRHRLHFIQKSPKDWDSFYRACVHDTPIPSTVAVARKLWHLGPDTPDMGIDIGIWTGRSNAVEEETMEWLRQHDVPWDDIRMRGAGDHTEDAELKRRWLRELSPEDRAQIAGVFEDRSRVVKMWREEGIPCFQVADGDF